MQQPAAAWQALLELGKPEKELMMIDFTTPFGS
jgi:hypothetical protein